MIYQSVNPANGKTLETLKETTDQEELDGGPRARRPDGPGATTMAPHSTESALVNLLKRVERAIEAGAALKNSGYGRELSRLGIQEFVNKKLVRTQAIDAPV